LNGLIGVSRQLAAGRKNRLSRRFSAGLANLHLCGFLTLGI